jgi:hypothetical protein
MFQMDILETQDGRTSLVDFNARAYSSIGIDVYAGANLPAIWCDWLLGKDPPSVQARPGRHYRWEEGEVKHALCQLRRGRVAAALAVFRPFPHTTYAIFDVSDPGPFVARLLNRIGFFAPRLGSRRSRGLSFLPGVGVLLAGVAVLAVAGVFLAAFVVALAVKVAVFFAGVVRRTLRSIA